MTWEHIFQAFYISFSDFCLVHEMSLFVFVKPTEIL
jgi:hypothetical protein